MSHAAGPDLRRPELLERCLGDVLREGARRFPHHHLTCIDDEGGETVIGYGELLERAERLAVALLGAGLAPGDKVILQTAGGDPTLPLLWACFLSGVVAVPTPGIQIFDEQATPLRRLHGVWDMLGRPPVLSDAASAERLRHHGNRHGWHGLETIAVETLDTTTGPKSLPSLAPDDLAMLPLTSGSTGRPKAVALSHRNILAMSAGTNQQNGFDDGDVALNWMPLDHPGAVVFLGVVPLDVGASQVHVPTPYVLADPLRWLDLIERHGASISWAPNFAFALINERLRAGDRRFDLATMRFLVSAGEQVTAATTRQFLETLEKHGLPDSALRPAFGMAETCSGITWSSGLSLAMLADAPTYISLGTVIPGAEMRITNESDVVLPEGESGYLQLRGPSVLAGYYDNPAVNAEVMRGEGWFRTGDLGFLSGGALHITGRSTEVVIVNGINVAANELESLAEEIEGVSVSHTAVFSVRLEDAATEELVVAFSPRDADPEDGAAMVRLAGQIRAHLGRQSGIRPAHLVALPSNRIPKTSIGKIQRSALKDRFLSGELAAFTIDAGPVSSGPASHAPGTSVSGIDATALETDIAEICRQTFGLESVDPSASFFELGGTSILMFQLVARLRELAPQIELVDLFQHPSARALTDFLTGPLETRPVGGPLPAGGESVVTDHDIAVIGLACRFPGADSIPEFWENLRNGRESISSFSVEELVAAGFDRAQVSDPDYVRASPVLRDPAGFDAGLFGYSAREAELLDPQQRLILHCAWEALEDAACDPARTPARIGSFIGASMNTYFVNNVLPNRARLDPRDPIDVFTLDSLGGFQAMVASDKDYISTRVAYKLDLRGPSVNVQTACSTGLVLVHLAVQSLLAGDCELALAGTASVQAPQAAGHLWRDGMIVSPDGHCRAFDAEAGGTIFGSGVGAVLLKPLQRAREDGDRIYAVIKGSAVNNDGGAKVSYMAPSGAGETEAARAALQRAGVPPETIGFVEAHGTGTRIGDPIEIRSLARAFGSESARRQWCALGSVKTNVGHLQISSGIAGFIKAVLAVHHREIPATLHFKTPNPDSGLDNSPFYVNAETVPWPASDHPRRAGVNSLGIGGTNAHVILEEAPTGHAVAEETDNASDRPWHILALSARTPETLDRLVMRYRNFLTEVAADPAAFDAPAPADLAFSANLGRHVFEHRRTFVFDTLERLGEALAVPVGIEQPDRPSGTTLWLEPVAVVPGMGADLLASGPVFAELIAEADRALDVRDLPGLTDVLAGTSAPNDDPAFEDAAMASLQVALAALLMSWGMPLDRLDGDPRLLDVVAGRTNLATLLGAAPFDPPLEMLADRDEPYGLLPVAPARPDGGLWPVLLERLGRMFCEGQAIDWAALDGARRRQRISLPTYPFETTPYWLAPPVRAASSSETAVSRHPLITREFSSPLSAERFFVCDYHPRRQELLGDHLINGRIVVSGACHVSMLLGTLPDVAGSQLTSVTFEKPMEVPADGIAAHLVLHDSGNGSSDFTLASQDGDGAAVVHVRGSLGRDSVLGKPERFDPAALRERCPESLDPAQYAGFLAERGIALGPRYCWASEIRTAEEEAFCMLDEPALMAESGSDNYGLHPGLLDGCFGLMIAATASGMAPGGTILPSGFDRLVVHRAPGQGPHCAWGRFVLAEDGEGATGSVELMTMDGMPVLSVEGLVGRRTHLGRRAAWASGQKTDLLAVKWVPAESTADLISDPPFVLLLRKPGSNSACLEAALHAADCGVHVAEPMDGEEHRCVLQDALALAGLSRLEVLDLRSSPGSALQVLQAAVSMEGGARLPLRVTLVTRGAVAADEHAVMDPAAAGVWGLARVFRLEHPAIVCRTVNFALDGTQDQSDLLAELPFVPSGAPNELDWSHGTVMQPHLVSLADVDAEHPACRPDAAYLVSGGSGALGGAVIGWLADSGARTIVALSRSGEIDPGVARQARDAGVALHGLAADVASPITLPDGLPPLRGIIHAAGILEDATFVRATVDQMEHVARPKYDGARQLAALANDDPLDFLVLFSSAASLLGNPGQAAYAAANAMLDAQAVQLRQEGIPALSISWGPWAGIGMAARSAQAGAVFNRIGIHPLETDVALRSLDLALAAGRPHVAVIDCDWDTYAARLKDDGSAPEAAFLAPLLRATDSSAAPQASSDRFGSPEDGLLLMDRLMAADAAQRQAVLLDFLSERLAAALSFTDSPRIDPDQALSDQGLDSLASVTLRNDLANALGLSLPVGMMFEHPTLNRLVAYLMTLLGEKFAPCAPVAASGKAGEMNDDLSPDDLDDLDLDQLSALVNRELDR